MEKFTFNLQRFAPTEGVTITGKTAGGSTLSGNTLSFKQRMRIILPSSVNRTTPIDMLADGRTLQDISDIFNNGKGPNCFIAGDYFDITFPSAITLSSGSIAANSTWRVVCLGINHNSSKEGTNRGHFCIGRTTDGKDICFFGHKMNSTSTNIGGWNGCEMKTFLNNTFYNALPTDLKSVITECTKYTDNTGNKSNTADAVTATSQKIWLMSGFEVFSDIQYANQYEQNQQAQYDYYKGGASKIRYQHASQDSAARWCLRSPNISNNYAFYRVFENGTALASDARDADGVVPCFTIGGN